ncbi:MAG: HNH endonuclease [Thermoleophilaceae bacterium]|nr:HNH endonuclease [Thermoleophilaceae bacterium]MDQ3318937.1 HNH endonuclease [Actinomycetota bacterium]MDQ3356348.1 HNH endonuclease [Actinomycetota bacterium]
MGEIIIASCKLRYCGSQERLESDHIIPVSKGGSNTEPNTQLRCERCNGSEVTGAIRRRTDR